MAKKATTTSAPATTSPAAATKTDSAPKTKYETMIIGVGKGHKDKRTKLEALAEKLGCKPSALIWQAIDNLLASPPAVAPVGAESGARVGATGSAPGFWTVPVMDAKGSKATLIKVVETENRSTVAGGRTFFRYTKDDAKSKTRARAQAIRAAQYDHTILGIKAEPVVEDIKAA